MGWGFESPALRLSPFDADRCELVRGAPDLLGLFAFESCSLFVGVVVSSVQLDINLYRTTDLRAVHKRVFRPFLKKTAEKTKNHRNTGVHLALA